MMKYLLVLVLVLVASPTFAAVLLTEEWSGPGNRPLGGWSYNTTEAVGKPTIDCDIPVSPSGGCALKFTYAAGTYASSMNGGRAAYSNTAVLDNQQDLYIGAWHRYSINFVYHPNGWKAEFFILSGSSNNYSFGYMGSGISIAPQWSTANNPTVPANVRQWDFNSNRNQWHWFEKRVRLGTPGACNDVVQMWIDDALYLDRSNVCFAPTGATTPGWGGMQHTAEYGGGGSTINQTQYWWVDHTVISTTRIGMPGGVAPPLDTIPPSTPQNLVATVSGSATSLSWNASTDNVGVSSYSILRCTGASCAPSGAPIGTATSTSFSNTGLTASTTHGYCVRANDQAGNQSSCSTPTQYVTTPAAASLYFTPLFADTFDRTNGTLGANWTGSFTSRSDFSLVSNQVRVGSLSADTLQVYSGTTPNDQYAKVQIASVGGNGAITPGVNLRMQAGPAVDGVVCQADVVANTSTIKKLTTGTYSNIVAPFSGWTYAALDYVWCEAVGTTYRMYAERGGVKTLLATGTDATHASGKAGLSNSVAAGGTGTIQYVGGQTGSFQGTLSAQTITFSLTGGLASTPAAGDYVLVSYATGATTDKTLIIENTSAVAYTLLVAELYSNDTVKTNLRSAGRVMPGTPETQVRLTCESGGGGTGDINDGGSYAVQVFRGVDATILEQAVQQGTGINTHLVDFGSITPTTTGAVVVAVGAGGLEISGAAYTTSGLTAFLSPVGATDAQESSIGAGYVPWVSGPVAPATFSGGGTVHAFNSYAWSLISLKPGAGGAANTLASSQLDNFEMGSISSTPVVPPTITGLTATASTITVTHGATTSTQIRVHYGNDAWTISYNVLRPIADFPGGVLTHSMPAGTQFLCVYPIDLAGVENTAVSAYRCVGRTYLEPIVGALDTSPATFGEVRPSGNLPAGTTSSIVSVAINKPAACRMDTVDQDYTLMDTTTTAVDMSGVNLLCSITLTGLTNGSSTTRYIASQFTNSVGTTYNSTTRQAITVTVANSTVDVTPPGQVLNLVARAVPNSADVFLDWATATGGDVAFYRVYISTDNATYTLSGNPVTITNTQRALTPNTLFYFKVEAVDTSGNLGALSAEASVTTFSTPDREPPSVLTGLAVVGSAYTQSALFTWTTGTDNAGPVLTQLESCQGEGCTNFTALGPRVAISQLITSLLPGTFYRVKGIHYDFSGNPSGGIDSPTYSSIFEFTTRTTGLSAPRDPIPFGVERGTGNRGASGTRSPRP